MARRGGQRGSLRRAKAHCGGHGAARLLRLGRLGALRLLWRNLPRHHALLRLAPGNRHRRIGPHHGGNPLAGGQLGHDPLGGGFGQRMFAVNPGGFAPRLDRGLHPGLGDLRSLHRHGGTATQHFQQNLV